MVNGEYKNIMRKLFMLIMVVALIALPAMAQDWQSTSAMQGSGSAYSSQVTAVGATEVTDMATTTTSTPNNGPRHAKKGNFDGVPEGGTQENTYPVGDAVLPLMLMALAFGGYIAIKRRKLTANN